MPKRNPADHTVESVGLVAERLQKLSAEILVSKSVMELKPPLGVVEVEWQTALEVGLARLQTWSDALRDAVDAKRLELASGRVSDSNGTDAKQRKRKA